MSLKNTPAIIIKRGNTTTITITVPESIDLTSVKHVYLTFVQDTKKIRKVDNELIIAEHEVSYKMTQAETLSYSIESPISIQLNWTYFDGSRGQTKIVKIRVDDTLEPEVLD